MEYQVEEVSPVQKHIHVTASAEEVNAALTAVSVQYKDSTQIAGYRKGMAPAGIIESRYWNAISAEAKQNLKDVFINTTLQELKMNPLGGVRTDKEGPIQRGNPWTCTLALETLPTFDIPNYEGFEIEQQELEVNERALKGMLEANRERNIEEKPITGKGPAIEGQKVTGTFWLQKLGSKEIFDKKQFSIVLGKKQALDAFEAIVKRTERGEEVSEDITFPADFIDEKMANKTYKCTVFVKSIADLLLDNDEQLAKKLKYSSVDEMLKSFKEGYTKAQTRILKDDTSSRIVDKLLKMVDYPLPPEFTAFVLQELLQENVIRNEMYGKRLSKEQLEVLAQKLRPRAEVFTRTRVFLLSVAQKEGLQVTEKEMVQYIYEEAGRNEEAFARLYKDYEESGRMFLVHDQILCDKASDLIYSRAKVTIVPKETAAAATHDAESAQQDGQNNEGSENSTQE